MRDTSRASDFYVEMDDGASVGAEGLSFYHKGVRFGGIYAGYFVLPEGGEQRFMEINTDYDVSFRSDGQISYNASFHDFSGSISTTGNIRPETNGAANCGLPDYRWRYIYTEKGVNESSDARKKRDIAPIEDAGALIMGLRPRQYRLRSEGKDGKRHTGFIAQHVLKLAPDWAAADGEDKDNLGLMYGEILAPLVQVVQDQQREIEELKARLSEMEASACGKSE